jgi:hypothetical protein
MQRLLGLPGNDPKRFGTRCAAPLRAGGTVQCHFRLPQKRNTVRIVLAFSANRDYCAMQQNQNKVQS